MLVDHAQNAPTGQLGRDSFLDDRYSTLIGLMVIGGLVVIGTRNFLLFHGSLEVLSVAISFGVFTVAWNARQRLDNAYFSAIGIAYFCIAVLDLLHTLSYKGMGVFPDAGANLPTQLWIAARWMEGIALATAPLLLRRRVSTPVLAITSLAGLGAVLLSIFWWEVFPDCFVEPGGLTPFKKTSEYLISLLLAIALFTMHRMRGHFTERVRTLISMSIVATIASEILFTFYISVYDISNFAGHILKAVSVLLLYEAAVVTAIRHPLRVLYHDIEQSRTELSEERDALQQALEEVKTLSGLLPMCSFCHKIRDDGGYWTRVEKYLGERTDAEFSHGLCPDCLKEHYPDYAQD